MAEKMEDQNDQALVPKEDSRSRDPDTSDMDPDTGHLEKMTDFKSYAKGLMDLALLTANANQMRHAFDICEPFKTIMVILLGISILLQLLASCLLLAERMLAKRKDYALCHKYNAAIGMIVVVIIIVNILAAAFGGPDDGCEHPHNSTRV